MFFLMGLFSCYNGLLYNEWFAIPYDWFGSCYQTYPLPNITSPGGPYNFIPVGGYPAVSD